VKGDIKWSERRQGRERVWRFAALEWLFPAPSRRSMPGKGTMPNDLISTLRAFAITAVLSIAGIVSAEDKPIRLGVLTALTGNWAGVGQNVTRGVTLAVEEINEEGGVLGRKLSFEVQDTDEELSGAKILSAYRYLKGQGYKIFIGPTGVPGSNSLGPLAAKDDVVILTSAALTHFERFGPNLFNVIGDSESTSRAAARWAYGKGLKTASVLRSEQPWELSQGQFFSDEFQRIGGMVLSVQESPADETEFRVQSQRIKREGAAVVFLATFNQVAFAAKALAKLQTSGVRTVALLDDAHLQAAAGALEGAVFYLFQGPCDSFKKKYARRFSEPPGYASDYSYDAVQAIAAAIRTAKSEEPDGITKALSGLEFPASVGTRLKIGPDRFVERQIQQYRVKHNEIVEENDPA
jgi:branched-chain amino acid transport system substrate-binding protein